MEKLEGLMGQSLKKQRYGRTDRVYGRTDRVEFIKPSERTRGLIIV